MGSKGINGITIEINGKTEKLQKALSGVNEKTRETQSELKKIERLLKLDPKNTELLAQKQRNNLKREKLQKRSTGQYRGK